MPSGRTASMLGNSHEGHTPDRPTEAILHTPAATMKTINLAYINLLSIIYLECQMMN